MNGQNQQTRVMREIPAIWDKIMRLAEQISNGEIIIKIHEKKISLSEYRIKNKPDDQEELNIFPLF